MLTSSFASRLEHAGYRAVRPRRDTFRRRVSSTASTTLMLLTAAAVLSGCAGSRRVAEPGAQVARSFTATISDGYDYLLYLPKTYESESSWPLVLFLHGSGERGSDLSNVRVHGPPKLVAGGRSFPFVLVSPQCPEGRVWDPHLLMALVDDVVSSLKIDRDRIYVTGLSMGGYGTWELGISYPDRFAALAPISGGGMAWRTNRITDVPVWAFHGTVDDTVSMEESQRMVERLFREGGKPRLTLYPGVEHDSWTRTYDNPELYRWLLANKRTRSR